MVYAVRRPPGHRRPGVDLSGMRGRWTPQAHRAQPRPVPPAGRHAPRPHPLPRGRAVRPVRPAPRPLGPARVRPLPAAPGGPLRPATARRILAILSPSTRSPAIGAGSASRRAGAPSAAANVTTPSGACAPGAGDARQTSSGRAGCVVRLARSRRAATPGPQPNNRRMEELGDCALDKWLPGRGPCQAVDFAAFWFDVL